MPKDNIVQVDVRKQYLSDMARYSIYTLYNRYVPNCYDGLKPVQRRILYAMWNDIKCISWSTKRKSANTVGTVIAKYHSHSDCLSADTKIVDLENKTISTIEELFKFGPPEVETIGINPDTLQPEKVTIHSIRIGQYTDEIYHIKLSNGGEIKCTANHPIMIDVGIYVKAEDLTNWVRLFGANFNFDDGPIPVVNVHGPFQQLHIEDIYVEHVNNVPMYDFTCDTTHNMLIPVTGKFDSEYYCQMICVHNSSVYEAMKPMTNPWEINVPLIVYDSNSGSIQGGPQAAMRYTESYMSQFALDCCIGEMAEVRQVVDWQSTFDNHTIEPIQLPVKIPLLLVNGTFGIAIGRRIEVPKHSLNDVIDATLNVLHDPKAKVVLIPDPCQKCEIIETDWKKISNMGFGYFTERGIVETVTEKNGSVYLKIKSMPDLIFSDTVRDKIEELVKENKLVQIADIQDHSLETELDLRIYLKKGADPEYVKQVIYKNTPLQDTKRVNMEVIDGTEVKRLSYKAYIITFLNFRRDVKFRLYNFRLQKAETRLHQIDTYIKILESGDVENIIHAIRNQKPSEEAALIEWLMKKLKITDLQAKFVLNTEIKRLSKGNLNKYKDEQKKLNQDVAYFIKMITSPSLIDKEIEEELIQIRQKYGRPRKSVIISEAEATNIPAGEFKVVVYESNSIKKMQLNDPIKSYRGDNPKCVTIGDNAKDILLFDEMGKVFRLPIHRIAFTDKNSSGLDIRMMIKNLTSNIISVMYLPILESLANKSSKYFIVTVSSQGMIKRMDLDDVIATTNSGLIYSKLNKGDTIKDIVIANHRSDIIVYTKSKALRMPIDSIPYLKRATLGAIAMKGNELIEGLSVVTAETKDVLVVTSSGRFNRITQSALERQTRAKTGTKVIKLTKGSYITNLFTVSKNTKIRCVHLDGTVTEIVTSDIPIGSSVSTGEKLTKDIIKAELINL